MRAKTLQVGLIGSGASVSATKRDTNTANNTASALITASAASACAADVSVQVSTVRGSFIPDSYIPGAFGQKGRYGQKITLRNTGSNPLLAPLSLLIEGLRNGTLKNPIAGVTTRAAPLNRPYLDVPLPGGALAPGAEVTLQLQFDDAKISLSYDVKVLAGAGGVDSIGARRAGVARLSIFFDSPLDSSQFL